MTDSSAKVEHPSVKILGKPWDTESEKFEHDLSKLRDFVPLSAKIFDPLGLLAPFTIGIIYVSTGQIGMIL